MNKVIVLFFLILITDINSASNTGSNKSYVEKEDQPQWLSFEVDQEAPKIVLIAGDEEYRSEEALPQLAKILSYRHQLNTKVLFPQDPEHPGIISPNYSGNIPGLENLENADLMIIFTRFRSLPDDQMKHIDAYLKQGKPVIGMRTATHAFQFESNSNSSYSHYSNSSDSIPGWIGGFGRVVLGEKWIAHWGEHRHQSTRGIIKPERAGHPILKGIKSGEIWGPTDVYQVRLPLPAGSRPLVLGQIINRKLDYDSADLFFGMRPTDSIMSETPNHKFQGTEKINEHSKLPMMPIAWTRVYQLPGGKEGKVFTTTMGASTDLLSEGFRKLLVNAVYWGLNMGVPEDADVEIVGDYQPSQFGFETDEYWTDKELKVTDLE